MDKISFRPIGYFQAEIELDDFKLQTSLFVIKLINQFHLFWYEIGTDVINQGILAISGHVEKLNKYQNGSKNSSNNCINASEVILNSKVNPLISKQ